MNFTVLCDVIHCGMTGSKQRFLKDGRAFSLLRMERAVNCSKVFEAARTLRVISKKTVHKVTKISQVVYAYVLFKADSRMGRKCEEVVYKTSINNTINQ